MNNEIRTLNNAFVDKLASNDAGQIKKAADAATEFTRMRMREEGFLRQILPPIPITNAQLTKQVHTDKPTIVVEKEPDSPAAYSVPFGTNPISRYIRQPRYAISFQRIETPKFTKDVDELRTYDTDVRQVLSDNSIKDMGAEEDGKFLAAGKAILGTPNTANITGVPMWNTTSAALTRSSFVEATKVMPRTRAHLEAKTALLNNVFVKEMEKWQRDQIGGDLAQDMLVDGYSERKLKGLRVIVTIKTDIVPEGTIYFFADPAFLGKFFTLEDVTMYIDRKYFFLEFFAYATSGAAIANAAGISRQDYAGTYTATNN